MSCECCTFSPAITTAADFTVQDGAELLGQYEFLAEHPNVEFVPLLRARALPGGPIERTFYDEVKARLLGALARGGPWDGLLLHLHGAASTVGLDDVEGDLLAAIRETVGPACRIAASYDLHGNVSDAVMRSLDLLTAYRTAPHVDAEETVARACMLLIDVLRRGQTPVRAFIPVPILLPGEKTGTEWEPGASLYAEIPEICERFGILDASFLMGYPWADEPRAGASVVVCGVNEDRVQAAARELAERLWDARTDFAFGAETGSVDECLLWSAQARDWPSVVSDSGDNPTAGGVGDVPYVLDRLLSLERSGALGGARALYAGIVDPAAVAQCAKATAGDLLELSLGGKLAPAHGQPLTVRGMVVSACGGEDGVVLDVGGIHVIVTARRTPFHRLADFERFGVDASHYRILVVKIGYLEPELKKLARLHYLALSPGAVSQDLASLPFRRLRRPIYPLDPVFAWQPPVRSLV